MKKRKFPISSAVIITGMLLLVTVFFLISVLGKTRPNTLGFFTAAPSMPRTVEAVFADTHPPLTGIDPSRIVTMITTGDIIPARSVNNAAVSRNNFLWPYEKTAAFTKEADLTLINLESPLLEKCPLTVSGMTFCGSPANADGLVYAGVDVANLANNHTTNYGQAGLESTRKILRGKNIATFGFGEISYRNVKGIRFAFLGYNDLSGPLEDIVKRVTADVSAADTRADVVVAAFHWGVEYVRQPTARQIRLAYAAVDAGADVIAGNHPHWIQPVEFYKDKLIIYTQGNFVFDQMWSEETKLGVVGKLTFVDKILADAQFFPVRIVDYGQPYFLEGEQKNGVLNTMKNASIELMKR